MNRIKELRKLHGYSQAELSEMLNVHQTAISQWERGSTYPDIVNLKAMSGLFGVSTDYLLGNDSEDDVFVFYDKLRFVCEEKGTTVSNVMESIGSSRGIALNWKKSGTTPSADIVQRLAQTLNCSVDELLDSNISSEEKKNAPTDIDERTKRFVDLFNRLTDDQKDIVLAQLEGIVSKL